MNYKTFLNWFFKLQRWQKLLIILFLDFFASNISFCLVIFTQVPNTYFLYQFDIYIISFICSFLTILTFTYLNLYNSYNRYASEDVLKNILGGSFISSLFFILLIYLFNLKISFNVFFIYLPSLFFLILNIRFFIRFAYLKSRSYRNKISIYCKGFEVKPLIEGLKWNSIYEISQIFTDDKKLIGKYIGKIPIDSFDNCINKLDKFRDEILLISKSAFANLNNQLLETKLVSPVNIKVIPSISDIINGDSNISEFKNLNIDDLLQRKPILPNPDLMSRNITNKVVLVTGGGGSIGSELCRQVLRWEPQKLLILDVSEVSIYKLMNEINDIEAHDRLTVVPLIGSVQDNLFIKNIFKDYKVDTVYHAAAYKHVPLMEQNIVECIKNNVLGTLNIVKNSLAYDVSNFTLISTDKAVKPSSFMGATKRIAEIICQTYPKKNSNTSFAIVRFGNVLASSGSVIPLFKSQIEKGGPITVTHPEATRYFMTIVEAAQLVIQAGSIAKNDLKSPVQVFILDMGKSIKIIEIAKKIIVLSGFFPLIEGEKYKKTNFNNNIIKIKIIGLRPGEKLHEELTYNSEFERTLHPKIFKVQEKKMSIRSLEILLLKINTLLNKGDYKKIADIIAIASGKAK